MPSFQEILAQVATANPLDSLRKNYLKMFERKRNRNVIAYYSGWLQNTKLEDPSISDEDMVGFMNAVHTCDRSKGLDLILHTPGGGISATESIVRYLRKSFHGDIECFVPQMAMSAGTMIACACKMIYMGDHSSLGPIDPQFGGIPAHGVIEEFNDAVKNVIEKPETLPIYQAIIDKYHPTFLGECEKAIQLSSELVGEWLRTGMFRDDMSADVHVENILQQLNNHTDTKQHDRHLDVVRIRDIGLKVTRLEEMDFQDAVLSIHHAYIITFSQMKVSKIIESASGGTIIKM